MAFLSILWLPDRWPNGLHTGLRYRP